MANDKMYDAIIIGGGPAGLTAGIYLARARYRVLIIEKEKFGGQITITSEVVNFPGIERTSGTELTEGMRKQAEHFGAEFMLAEVNSLELDGDIRKVHTSKGTLECFGVLLATGAHPRMVGFKGEEEFRGHGVAYCATCDGEFFTGKEVFVIGGGFAAAEEAVFLTKYAKHVTILIRGDDFTCAKATADEARNNPNITVLTNTSVKEVVGDSVLSEITYVNSKTSEETTYKADDGDTFGVFVFAGYSPSTELVADKVELNDQGYVVTDRQQKTSLDGVYAAGDVCIKNLRQAVTAAGDGATAATELEKYCKVMHDKTGIIPEPPVSRVSSSAGSGASNGAAGSAASGTAAASEGSAGGMLFDENMIAQLNTVFDKMETNLVLKLYLDERPVSKELEGYMETLVELTDKLTLEKQVSDGGDAESETEIVSADQRPCVRVCNSEGTWTGLAFHGVPGGHEFTSFVLGLYNAAGPGQPLDDSSREKIQAIDQDIDMKIMVSLTCTMCPELVTSAQRIASLNPHVKTNVYDLNHFPELKDKYNVMSVPCYVINDGKPLFGKKNVDELLDVIM